VDIATRRHNMSHSADFAMRHNMSHSVDSRRCYKV